MSHWTYVNGTIGVKTPFSTSVRSRIEDYILWSIRQIRKRGVDITGSESPVKFFVHCGYYPSCDPYESAETWDYGYITVVGSLRDREDQKTIDETDAFLRRLEHFLRVEEVNITVSGDEKHTFNGNAYSKINEFDDDYDKNEKFRDKLFNIQLANSHRFYDELLTLEKASDIAEFITHVSPDTLVGFLNHFGIGRTIDWEFTDRRVEWFKDHKVNVKPVEDKHYEEWFRKRKYPAKVTLVELKDELNELAYGDKRYDFTAREHKKITTLRTAIDAAQGSKVAKIYIDKWS